MTNSIKQVLEMNKAGTITDEQAEQLIKEITREQSKAEEPKRPEAGPRDFRNWDDGRFDSSGFHSFAHATVKTVLDGVSDGIGHIHRSMGQTIDGNDFHLSHAETPSGTGYVFRGNRIRMSKVGDLHLENSEFTDNKADASKLVDFHLSQSRLSGCDVKASAVFELELDHSEFVQNEIFSSKAGEIRLHDESAFRYSRLHASAVKELALESKSIVEHLRVNCAVLAEGKLSGTTMTGCEFSEMKMKELQLERSRWNNVIARDVALSEVRTSDTQFDNVLVSATECWGWKKRGWTKTRFENVSLKNVGFVDCRLHDVTIRDVSVSDLKIQGLYLEHQTIVGNDAFLRAIELHRK